MTEQQPSSNIALPRVAITYCTQCKWMLRATYYAQELFSTFNTSIGEIALIPTTGGIFTVHIRHIPKTSDGQSNGGGEMEEVLIWDRKTEGGFPETKILKQRVRNIIEPEKKLGHSDTPSNKAVKPAVEATAAEQKADAPDAQNSSHNHADGSGQCEDCK